MRRAFVMMSAEREGNTVIDNTRRTLELSRLLYDKFTNSYIHPCIGKYNGALENSFRVDLDEQDIYEASILPGSEDFSDINDDLYELWDISQRFAQESVLYVNPLNDAFLIFHDKTIYHLGTLNEVTNLRHERAFTIDLDTEVNWVVR